MLIAPAPAGLGAEGWRTAAVAVLMAVWWVTEAIPIPATALLPVLLMPALGVMPIERATAPFANPVIYLFLGGFLIAAAVEASGLHRRLALAVIRLVGAAPSRVVGGFMLAAAFLSMWISNTATVVMMLPLATSVIELEQQDAPAGAFGLALLLGLAYAASVGGLGTLIGTPPNALLAGFLAEAYEVKIGFGTWMLLGVPLVVVALPMTWLLLTRVMFPLRTVERPGASGAIERQWAALGPLSRTEFLVGSVTALAATGWIFRSLLDDLLPGLSDAGIAIGAALLLFLVPGADRGRRALEWSHAERLPWGVLVFFGGGLSLAAGIQDTGLARWIGSALAGAGALPLVLIVLGAATLMIFLTEFTSNTASAASFLPVAAALATAIGVDPVTLAVPIALAASCAFMMPIATPPNAIVYGTGRIPLRQMIRAGLVLNLGMAVLITIVAVWVAPLVLPAAAPAPAP
jgi:sodium-dependent dicarboxylate transporter 2/3/5